jgi:RimJ/RimL family protein N-acetyltransferase
MNPIIREAEITDATAMVAHVKRVLTSSTYTLTMVSEFTATEESQRLGREEMKKNNNLLLAAEHEGHIIGNLAFFRGTKQRNAHTGEFALGVDPEHRSKGIGKKLINKLIHWAEADKYIEKVWLQVISGNDPALSLYKQLGFQEEGVLKKQIKFSDGTYADLVSMALFLKQNKKGV